MEIHKATIIRGEDSTILALNINEDRHDITLTEDKPNDVKGVFNTLLKELKKGEFNFEIEDDTEDLYFHICKEYIIQLNSELTGIYKELDDYGLIEEETE